MKRTLLTIILLLCAWTLAARTVTGVVKSGKQKLAGVIVTDGTNITTTDRKGVFRFEIADDAEFVYITTPSGYTAPTVGGVPSYFRKAGGHDRFVFDLVPFGNGSDFAVIAVADPQTATERHMKRFINETEADIMKVIAGYESRGVASVGLYLGDIAWDRLEFFRDYREHMERLGIPVYNTIGNHDYDLNLKGDAETGSEFRNNFGPLYYGFNVADNYFIVLDNIIYDTNKKFKEKIDKNQLDWLERYVKFIPAGAPVYIAMHAPFMKHFRGNKLISGGERILDIFAAHELSFITGHTHLNSNWEVVPGGPVEHNVGSACGSWWFGDYSRDGSPNGYKVFEISGGKTEWYYKTTGREREYQFEAYGRGAFIDRANAVVAKVWDWDPEWKVEWCQDGRPMGEMERFDSFDPDYLREIDARISEGKMTPEQWNNSGFRHPVKSFFYFAAVPDPYARDIAIIVTDRFGNVFRRDVDLNNIDARAYTGGMGPMPEDIRRIMNPETEAITSDCPDRILKITRKY